MRRGERGGALPAALALQLILLLAGMQVALAAATFRLALARAGARLQAERLAAAAVAVAGEASSERLLELMAADGLVPVDLSALRPPGEMPEVVVGDDEDGDGDAGRDSNGRIFLTASAAVAIGVGSRPSRAQLTREVILSARVPLAAALLDCGGGLAMCGGRDGCPVPPARVVAAGAVAVGVPRSRSPELAGGLFTLSREVLRAARERCFAGACGETDLPLLQAAATQVMRRLETAASDASALPAAGVLRLVDGLLALNGTERGPGLFPWWDGTWRAVAEMSVLPPSVSALMEEEGHVPSLAEHAYPQFLRGDAAWGEDGGLCRLLPSLLAAAEARSLPAAGGEGVPPGQAVRVVNASWLVDGGEAVEGQGLLVLRDTLTVVAGGRLSWRGSVVLDGGQLVGAGAISIAGSLLIAAGSPAQALDLESTALQLTADREAHRQAWKAAGNLLLSAWSGPGAP